MLLLAALLGGASQPHSELLREHREVCARVENVDAVRADALGSGWRPVADNRDSRLGLMLAQARGEAGQTLLGEIVDKGYIFEKDVGGRTVGMLVMDMRIPHSERLQRVRTCRHFDFTATGMISEREAREWVGREPSYVAPADMPGFAWAPGLFGSKSVTDIAYQDPEAEFGRPGLSVSTSIEDWNGTWPY